MDLNAVMNNPDNIYYGHGIGSYSQEKLDSILKNGIRCSHGSLYFTSEILGMGNQISDSIYNKLNNWSHLDSKQIIIVSLPSKFNIMETYGTNRYNKANSAFYYDITEEQKQKFNLADGEYVMPEFILGYYDATTNTFNNNPNYYELLPQEKQNEIIERVKKNYYDILTENNTLDIQEYKEILEEVNWEFPLTDEEVMKYKSGSNVQTQQKEIKRVKLPNGVLIPAKQYIEEVVNPLLKEEKVTLKSGAIISKKQYIEEFILGEFLELYNGDLEKLLAETTIPKMETKMSSEDLINKIDKKLAELGVEIQEPQIVSSISKEGNNVRLTSEYLAINVDYMEKTNKKLYFDIGESLIDLALDEVNKTGNFINRYMEILTENCKNEIDVDNLMSFLNDIEKTGKTGKEFAELLKPMTTQFKNNLNTMKSVDNINYETMQVKQNDFQFIYEELYKRTLLLNNLYDEEFKRNVDPQNLYDLLEKYNKIQTDLAVLEGIIDKSEFNKLNEMIDLRVSHIERVLEHINNFSSRSLGFTTSQFLIVFISVITIVFVFFIVILFK